MSDTMTHQFTIEIGDWSGDGHGKSATFRFTANKPIEAVREAYFAAIVALPKCNPENFCAKYEDRSVPTETREALRAAGFPLRTDEQLDNEESLTFGEMAAIVAWFCGKGDSDLVITADEVPPVPSLSFYGYDAKGRHIGGHGYGLFH